MPKVVLALVLLISFFFRDNTIEQSLSRFGVELYGRWTESSKLAILDGVRAVSNKLGQVLEVSPEQAFVKTYHTDTTPLVFIHPGEWGYCEVPFGGCTVGPTRVNRRDILLIAIGGLYNTADAGIRNRNIIVHELGHLFASIYKDTIKVLARDISNNAYLGRQNPTYGKYYGFASCFNHFVWQMSYASAETPSEIFADMYLGWTFDTWYNGSIPSETRYLVKSNWINIHMNEWLGEIK